MACKQINLSIETSDRYGDGDWWDARITGFDRTVEGDGDSADAIADALRNLADEVRCDSMGTSTRAVQVEELLGWWSDVIAPKVVCESCLERVHEDESGVSPISGTGVWCSECSANLAWAEREQLANERAREIEYVRQEQLGRDAGDDLCESTCDARESERG